MSYRIQKLVYKNLKYVNLESPVTLDFSDSSLILLDGPNGYGKSTVFDAIELLLTGGIKHFHEKIINAGTIKKEVLANNLEEDMIIDCEMECNGEILKLQRVFEHINRFDTNVIYIDGKEAEQEALYRKLGVNENIIEIAIYISQTESLDFLTKKYKDRKSEVAKLIDQSKMDEEEKNLNKLREKIEEKINADKKKLGDEIEKKAEEVTELKNKVQEMQETAREVEYERLFYDKEYEFDKKNLSGSVRYISLVQPLKEIKEFIEKYDLYLNSKNIEEVEAVLNLTSTQMRTVFFQEAVERIKGQKNFFVNLEMIEELLFKGDEEKIKELNSRMKVGEKEAEEIENILRQKQELTQQLKNNEKYISDLTQKRETFILSFEKSVEEGIWKETFCPLCGRESEELKVLMESTKKKIAENSSVIAKQVEKLNQQITAYLEHMKESVQNLVNENKKDYDLFKRLKKELDTNIKDIKKEMEFLQQKNFKCEGEVDIQEFDKEYIKLKQDLENQRGELGEKLESQKMERFHQISFEYYGQKKPNHKPEQIQKKISYIAYMYLSEINSNIQKLSKDLKQKETTLEEKNKKYNKALDVIDAYIEKYKKAQKLYMSNLAKKIRIPLYIYSGKIIQTYPMGLGICAEVEESKIVFHTEKKKDDIFNYLSAGQLNGAMLAIMLSIRETLDFTNSLDLIMIDDPLQTIDDISAFSYADLLAENFGESQLILSTHEEEKSNLLEFKFLQHDKKVKKFNMHDRYINRELGGRQNI